MTVGDDEADEYLRALPDPAQVLRLVAQYAANPDVWLWNRWTLERLALAALERIELSQN
jgi:hypothetical protein